MSRVGFVGAGVMGAPMMANLVRAGHTVLAHGRSERSRERIASAGAEVVAEAGDVCDDTSVVITMVSDSPDVRALVLGDGGIAARLSSEQVFVDMSTVTPATSRDFARTLGERGIGAVDAPVSGGEQAAVDGTLSIMVGGEPEHVDRVRPVLAAMGTSITHVGPAGNGQLVKAANQLVVAINLQAVAEAVVLLETAGVDVEAALEAIGGGLAGSTVLQRKRQAFLTGDFSPGFRIALHDKDLGIVAETAREQHNALPVTALVSQLVGSLHAQGHGDLDHAALVQLLRQLNGRDG